MVFELYWYISHDGGMQCYCDMFLRVQLHSNVDQFTKQSRDIEPKDKNTHLVICAKYVYCITQSGSLLKSNKYSKLQADWEISFNFLGEKPFYIWMPYVVILWEPMKYFYVSVYDACYVLSSCLIYWLLKNLINKRIYKGCNKPFIQ